MPPSLPAGAATRTITVADRGWHTDLCVAAPADASDPLLPLAAGFSGASVLCFGFGERHYLLSPQPGLLERLAALLPSRAALLMTALRAPPAAAFGADSVVVLHVTAADETALRGFLRRSVQNDAAGAPIRLRDGPYLGSVYFAATGTYDAFTTCNTWTADGLRTAGVKIGGPVIFAGQVMSQLRRIAAKRPQ